MKKLFIKFACLLSVVGLCAASRARTVTLVVTLGSGGTNTQQICIGTNEVAQLVSYTDNGNYRPLMSVTKDEIELPLHLFGGLAVPPKHVIVGPARIQVTILGSGLSVGYCTFSITPESFPPDKTIVIPAGGGANLGLESSTNLINWVPATLGVYTNQPVNCFFRLKAERVP